MIQRSLGFGPLSSFLATAGDRCSRLVEHLVLTESKLRLDVVLPFYNEQTTWDEHKTGRIFPTGLGSLRSFSPAFPSRVVNLPRTSIGRCRMKSYSTIASLSVAFLLLLALSGCGAESHPVRVQNDLGIDAQLSLCDDDPVTAGKGQTVTVHPLVAPPGGTCVVYKFDIYLGCLDVSAQRQHPGDPVRLSQMDTTVSESKCGE